MTKARWLVHIPGCLPITMVGEACGYEEALAFARGIWPEAEVE